MPSIRITATSEGASAATTSARTMRGHVPGVLACSAPTLYRCSSTTRSPGSRTTCAAVKTSVSRSTEAITLPLPWPFPLTIMTVGRKVSSSASTTRSGWDFTPDDLRGESAPIAVATSATIARLIEFSNLRYRCGIPRELPFVFGCRHGQHYLDEEGGPRQSREPKPSYDKPLDRPRPLRIDSLRCLQSTRSSEQESGDDQSSKIGGYDPRGSVRNKPMRARRRGERRAQEAARGMGIQGRAGGGKPLGLRWRCASDHYRRQRIRFNRDTQPKGQARDDGRLQDHPGS